MTKKSHKFSFKKFLPYLLATVVIIGLVVVGSQDKNNSDINLSLSTFASEDAYSVSTDQISELYTVADLSDAFSLASADTAASNYVSVKTLYQSGQTSTEKLEKSHTVYVSSRGVIGYTVKEGDTMDSIAAAYGLTTDQIRWSNNKKNTDVAPGDTLYLPSTAGIVYNVKSGDTLESIADTYGSSVDEIIALNDLEISGLSEGMSIVIAGGSLPTTERPEYVAPAYTYSYAYTYLGNTSERENIEVLQYGLYLATPYTAGQCTSYAWYRRQDLPSTLGNASSWAANAAAAGYLVNHTPSAGSIFQTTSGWYGHVGYVESVNPDGSIVISEMNYGGWSGRVIRATIPASVVGNFYYIH